MQIVDEAVDLTLPMNDPTSLLDALHEAVQRFLDRLRMPPADEWRMLFELAVSEIAANIVEHVRPSTIRFRVAAQPSRVVAEFTDSGRGWLRQPRPAAEIDQLPERGRGLSLAWKAVDEVAYERMGKANRWRLMKVL
ncbi:MAG: ATP-binding protein [Candidatus Dormibacteraeota bacterium]|nr:ATP-binding protein [Candidatus Dormibacteraeota bacterium]